MAISLFKHNQDAYNAAAAMLAETGKAAVIHPTGTGKSFIGFKLCEDNPDKNILWLSPSEYIFKTQLENLADVSNGWKPENITFMTYAKLTNLTDADMEAMNPDFFVIDEFHRGGSEIWGGALNKLLSMHSDVPMLGLTATAVRYLDNQRNMAKELFDNCIASEMTLGEAIVRGIIQSPKYVLSIYSYQEDLERYERRVKKSKRKITRDLAEEYLEKLRRMLKNAVGISEIFRKHITSVDSKFIVFCSGYEHMLEMIGQCKKWMRDIDNAPHVYSVYSLDSQSEQQFKDFKDDNEPEHLKLLFCIDALNEGIHIDNISGVILLRPTVSPIVYKQQIGRALTASGSSVPLIFDIVNNVENLYSIGALQDEVQYTVTYYESTGRGDLVVNDAFQVIDEVADVKKLFAQLEDVLSASWEQMYDLAVQYYHENHDSLEMPAGFMYHGYPLDNWLRTQRKVYQGKTSGILDDERKAKLEAIGMRWNSLVDVNFNKMYQSAYAYYQTHGDLYVPNSYIDENGAHLGEYIHYLRKNERKQRKSLLNEEQRNMLTEIGMDWTWTKERNWEENYALLAEFMTKNPHKPVPLELKTVTGGSLRDWKTLQITAYRSGKLSSEKIEKLERIGVYLSASDKWTAAYSYALAFYEKHHHTNFPQKCVVNGIWMKIWWDTQMNAYFGKSKKLLTAEQRELLEALNIRTHKSVAERRWFEVYDFLKTYYASHGNITVPGDLTVPNNCNARKWICAQRAKYKKGELSEEKIKLLSEIDMVWQIAPFQEGLSHAETYAETNGCLLVPASYVCDDGYNLGQFLTRARQRKKQGTLSQSQIDALDSIGMIWDTLEEKFQAVLEECKEYYAEHGDLHIPRDVVGKSGVKLYYWVTDCRRKVRSGKFPPEKVELLRQIGINA